MIHTKNRFTLEYTIILQKSLHLYLNHKDSFTLSEVMERVNRPYALTNRLFFLQKVQQINYLFNVDNLELMFCRITI